MLGDGGRECCAESGFEGLRKRWLEERKEGREEGGEMDEEKARVFEWNWE